MGPGVQRDGGGEMIWRETEGQAGDTFQVTDLKICDLCGTLNLSLNELCFSCSWHGHFDTRPEVVRLAMEMVRGRDGAITLQHITDARTAFPPTITLFGRVRHAISQAGKWLFG